MADPHSWKSADSGDWGSARTRLADRGFTWVFTNDTIAQYNASEGIETA